MPFEQDKYNGYLMGLSGVNGATFLGATNTTWSANATVTLVCTALRALAPLAGTSPDMVEKVCNSLRTGVNSGAMAETHGVTTIAGAQALFTALLPGVPAGYTGFLRQ